MDTEIIQNLTSSVIYIISWILLRFAIQRSVVKWRFKSTETRLRWAVQIRNLLFFALVLGLMLIWASALKTFALSVVVIASAIAIGCKEYIMCFLGGLLKASSDHFVVGDRVTINDFRGDVINHTPFTTTLFEVGPGKKHHQYTGKKITIPNSVLLTTPVINENHGGSYSFHTFSVRVPRESDWKNFLQHLQKASNKVCDEYINNAQMYFNYLGRKGNFDPPKVDPLITLGFDDEESVEMVVRVPTPAKDKDLLEQEILKIAYEIA